MTTFFMPSVSLILIQLNPFQLCHLSSLTSDHQSTSSGIKDPQICYLPSHLIFWISDPWPSSHFDSLFLKSSNPLLPPLSFKFLTLACCCGYTALDSCQFLSPIRFISRATRITLATLIIILNPKNPKRPRTIGTYRSSAGEFPLRNRKSRGDQGGPCCHRRKKEIKYKI